MAKDEDEFMVMIPYATKFTDAYLVALGRRNRAMPLLVIHLYEEACDATEATQTSSSTGTLHNQEDALLLTLDAITVQWPFETYNINYLFNLGIIERVWCVQGAIQIKVCGVW
jgi:hypothetical protein